MRSIPGPATVFAQDDNAVSLFTALQEQFWLKLEPAEQI